MRIDSSPPKKHPPQKEHFIKNRNVLAANSIYFSEMVVKNKKNFVIKEITEDNTPVAAKVDRPNLIKPFRDRLGAVLLN